jgi:ribosome-associated protein
MICLCGTDTIVQETGCEADLTRVGLGWAARPHFQHQQRKDDHITMRTSTEAAPRAKPFAALVSPGQEPEELKDRILAWLDDAKAEDLVEIDLRRKSPMGDFMVIATGAVGRHVAAIAERVLDELKKAGVRNVRVEGLAAGDWVLIDAGDVIVHVFRPEVRAFYNLEKMWSGERPVEPPAA